MIWQADLDKFYTIMDSLINQLSDYRYLAESNGRLEWPRQGVYFFFRHGETRSGLDKLRVVRVGTHAVSTGSKTTLWNRLSQHRGSLSGRYAGGGNHRGSVFRLHVGSALLNQDNRFEEARATWGKGTTYTQEIRIVEHPLEREVSQYIGAMPFLWLKIEDQPGSNSMRRYIERNSIALLSHANKPHIDHPSPEWLGRLCANEAIRVSGMWNVDGVYDAYNSDFLAHLRRFTHTLIHGKS